MNVESQRHPIADGHMIQSKKKKKKTKTIHEELSGKLPNSHVAEGGSCSADGNSIGKKKSKKMEKKSQKDDTKSSQISKLLEEIIAPFRTNVGNVARKKNKKKKVQVNRVNLCRKSDTGISVRKENQKKINGKDLEKSLFPPQKKRISADEAPSASTSNDSGKTTCRYRPAEEVKCTKDFTEAQRTANEYVLSGYLPTVEECLGIDYGGQKRPFIPQFKGDPICPYCHTLFRNLSNMERHVGRVHFKIRKHRCDWCDKFFADKLALKEHETIHMDSTPYVCEICDRAFRYKSHKCVHMKTHVRENWNQVLKGLETKRKKQKVGKESEPEKASRKNILDEHLEDEDNLIDDIISTQTETINGIKESFS